MWQRSSLTRYIACGPRVEELELQVIVNEGEIQKSLLAYKTERVVTGTKQILKLIKVTTSKTTLPEIQSPVTLEDLFYVYPKVGGKEMVKTEERKELLQNLPLTENLSYLLSSWMKRFLSSFPQLLSSKRLLKNSPKLPRILRKWRNLRRNMSPCLF